MAGNLLLKSNLVADWALFESSIIHGIFWRIGAKSRYAQLSRCECSIFSISRKVLCICCLSETFRTMNTFLSLWGGLLCLAFVLTASAANSAPEEVIIIAARESRISVQGQPRWAFRYDFTPGTSGRLPSSVCIQVCEEFALLEDAVTANRNGTVHYYSGWYGFSGYCIRWDVKSYVDNQDGEDFWIANIPATHGFV